MTAPVATSNFLTKDVANAHDSVSSLITEKFRISWMLAVMPSPSSCLSIRSESKTHSRSAAISSFSRRCKCPEYEVECR